MPQLHPHVLALWAFPAQVLSRALESWGLTVMSLESEEARDLKAAPTSAEAFICNLQVPQPKG